MSTFLLRLQDSTHSQEIPGVTSSVGEDSSGSFGILAGHARFMTSLIIGLARFRTAEQSWKYLAAPGAVLYFKDNILTVSTRHYLLDDNYQRISDALQQQLLTEEEKLHDIKKSLHTMEEEVFKRLWELGRKVTG